MTIGIIGYKGKVASAIFKQAEIMGLSSTFIPLMCDITIPDTIKDAINKSTPDIVVHLAARSGVAYCEDKKNQDEVIKVNVEGTYNVCSVCEEHDIPLVYLSTDHIFAGIKGRYTERFNPKNDYPPVNYYGLTKYTAENIVKEFKNSWIVRTSTLFSYEREMIQEHLEPLLKGETTSAPDFIYRSFMYLPHFATSFIVYLMKLEEMPRLLHISGDLTNSWFNFVCFMASLYNIHPDKVLPYSEDSQVMAPRPKNAGLNVTISEKVGLPQFSYIQGLTQMVEDNG